MTQDNLDTLASETKNAAVIDDGLLKAQSTEPNHLGSLTGLRFFAAFAVVIGHLIADTGGGLGRFGLPHRSIALGGGAVSFFFVLSGFILTYVYKDRLKWSGVKKFYFKRWARIWPLHLVCMLIAIYAIGMRINRWDMFAVNLALLHSWVPQTPWVFSFNGVSWSISTEMFFYFMFPFLLIGGQRLFWVKYLVLWCAAGGVVVWMQSLANNPDFASYDFNRAAHVNPFLRLPEFCTGMAVGFIFFNRAAKRKQRPVIVDTIAEVLALSLIPLNFWLFYNRPYHLIYLIRKAEWGGSVTALWVQYSGMFLVFAIVIYVFSRSRGLLTKFLSQPALIFAGEISFALYMIHLLVIITIERMDWTASGVSPWLLAACAIVISICLATFLYKFVEMPAKSALMNLHDGKFKKSLTAVPTQWFRFLKTPTFWCYAVLLGASIGTLSANFKPLNFDSQMQQVVASSHAPYRDVSFGGLIRLMGVKATPTARGIELDLVWQKQAPLNRSRFFHFCDSEGNIVAQLAPETDVFESAPLHQPVLEKILIFKHKLDDPKITELGIGFFSKEIDPLTNKQYPLLKVSKGPRGMSNFRLNIVGENQMKNLRLQLEKFEANKTD